MSRDKPQPIVKQDLYEETTASIFTQQSFNKVYAMQTLAPLPIYLLKSKVTIKTKSF